METDRRATVTGGGDDSTVSSDAAVHAALRVDDVVHQRVRLGLLAVLHATDSADFGYLKQVLELTDGNLNRHLDVLARAGLVTIHKTKPSGGRQRTIASITDRGVAAFEDEVRQLERFAQAVRRRGTR